MSALEFAKMLGVSETTVRRYRARNKVFAIDLGSGTHRYPAWQIHRGALLAGLKEALSIFGEQGKDPSAVQAFFLSPSGRLSQRRPLDLLRESHVEPVLRAARLSQ